MTTSLRLVMGCLVVGGLMGLIVLGAAAAAGSNRKRMFFLSGLAWGVLTVGLALTDCLPGSGPGPISEGAFPLYFGGVALFPAVMVRGQTRWYLRYVYGLLVMLLTAVPGFLIAVTAALCTMT